MSKTRESGWYHIKIDGRWTIAAWTYHNEVWRIPFTDGYWYESAFEEIDERRIVREETKNQNYTGFSGNTERIPQNE